MPSKLLQLAEETQLIKTALNNLTSKGPHVNQKRADLILRQKAINHRINTYGQRGNLFKLTIAENVLYFTDIDEADIPFLARFYIKELDLPSNTEYGFEKIELGKAYK